MREWVGECKQCGKAVYCENGFLGGTVLKDGTLICFDCEDDSPSQEPPTNGKHVKDECE